MVVRVRISRGPRIDNLLGGLSGLLSLVAAVCFILGVWRIAAGLGWVAGFFLSSGFLSHWQVWMAGGVGAQLLSFRLTRRRALIS